MNSVQTVIHLIAQLRFGAGRCVADMAIEQARGLKHRVMVCASVDTDEYWRTDTGLADELRGNGVEFHVLGDFFRRQAGAIHECAARLRELRKISGGATVIHAHTAMAAAVGHWAKPDALVATCHGWGSGRPADIDLEDSLAYQLCDSVLTYSDYWLDRLRIEMAVQSPQKIWMGVGLDRFPAVVKKHKNKAPKIVTVCELTFRKGVDVLLNAMPAVWKKTPEAELHIIGHGDSAEELRSLAAELDGGNKRICFHGTVEKPFQRLGEFDLFVLASRSDNLPLSVLEAMLAKLPVVATAVGGVPEILGSSSCGRVVPAESSAELGEGMLSILEQGRDRLEAMGQKGERFVRERMDVRKTAATLEGIYRDALRGRISLKAQAE
jgi:glycosyltransferase involved in cell wall biosynthesis